MNLGKNVQYYRMRKGVSRRDLADAIGATEDYVARLEKSKTISDVSVIKKVCFALKVPFREFMSLDSSVDIVSASFQSSFRLSFLQQQSVLAQMRCAAQHLYDTCQLLGISCGGCSVFDNRIRVYEDVAYAAAYLREVLGIGSSGPVGNLIHLLESKGICVVLIATNLPDRVPESFVVCNAMTDKDFPIIALNADFSLCEQRFAIAEELARMMFEDATEEQVEDIAGRFLLPTDDLKWELGTKRAQVNLKEVSYMQKEYGVQAHRVVLRATEEYILPKNRYRFFLESHEQLPDVVSEKPARLEQLVRRAYVECVIDISGAAELLDCDTGEAVAVCRDEE